ncbi:hypothetical protein [Cesiribacter andamanensis]|uniref:Lipoprotein n=1 Tax=Cesiribacter andamanensis AMV16 TaxID=1279009 RepID=M7N3J8_9BACT|nr:hypothetical protein [Cesiribacter andamanensis]EMR01771.1 hypothetical protein ADICEAN_03091 [Cesiribacter andamanensis AMV16]
MNRILLLFCLMLLAGCGLVEELPGPGAYSFPWLRQGNRLYYDYYTAQDTIRDFRYLEVGKKLLEKTDSGSFRHVFTLLGREWELGKEGLYGTACTSCEISIVSCMSKFNFLYAPIRPVLQQELPAYSCGKNPDYQNQIVALSRQLHVPMGTYSTYAMLHPSGDISYWSPEHGLIQYEKYNAAGVLQATLKLNRIEK